MATKAEIIVMGEDLFKRLGGNRTKDGRIVRALLAGYKIRHFPEPPADVVEDCPICNKEHELVFSAQDDRRWFFLCQYSGEAFSIIKKSGQVG